MKRRTMAADEEKTPLLIDQEIDQKMGQSSQEEQERSHHGRDPQTTFSRNSCYGKLKNTLRSIKNNVTLEPMLFLKMVAESNFVVVADTLEIQRICQVNLNYSEEDCLNMDDGNHTNIQTEVQRYQNLFNYKQSLIDSILPLFVVIFVGSLSDRYGRKPFLLAVLAGFVCMSGVYILATLNPSWPVEILYAATLSVDIAGSWVVFNMVVYSYLADITSTENRTQRMGVLDAVWYLGGPLGNLIGGWLYYWSGFLAVFIVSAVLWLVCFLYILFLIHESVSKESRTYNTEEAKKYGNWGPLKNVVVLVKTAFKKRPGNARSLIFWLLSLKLLVFFTQGHQMYLWARRVLQWGATEFSTWSSVDFFIHQIGMLGWLFVAAKLKLHDTIIAVGGLMSQGLWCAVLACIPGPGFWWLVGVASVLGMFESTIEPAIRTMLTVVVGEAEAGKILALNGLLEAIWLIVDRTIFTGLYNTFVEIFPQINLVVQGGVCFVLILMLLYLWRIFKRQPTQAPTLRNIHTIDDDGLQTRNQDFNASGLRERVY